MVQLAGSAIPSVNFVAHMDCPTGFRTAVETAETSAAVPLAVDIDLVAAGVPPDFAAVHMDRTVEIVAAK